VPVPDRSSDVREVLVGAVKKRREVSLNRFRMEQPDRTAWRNILVSVVACLVLFGTLPFLWGGTEIETRSGQLLSLVGLGVILKWGYWRNRR
jgi:protein-S-isoprenylcysteine O-methyltransferase Ste14